MNALESGAWEDVAIVLSCGAALIVLLAAIVCRVVSSVAWQRIVWQLATLSVALLLVTEAAGFGRAAIALVVSPADAEIVAEKSTTPSPGIPGEGWGEGPSSGSLILHPQLLSVVTEPDSIAETVSAAATEPTVPLAETAIAASVVALTESSPLADKSQPDAPTATKWPAIFWLVGTTLVLLRLAAGHVLLALFARRRPRIHDPLLLARIRQIASRLGLRRTVRVLQVSKRSGPMAFGAWRPTIGLPPGFAHEFTIAEQDAMLAHELAHLAGRDTLWHLLADLVAAALWWHPLAWWNRTQLHAASEAVADEASLVLERGPEVLAGCLVALARRVAPRAAAGWVSIEGNGFRSSLGRRVARLVDLRRGDWRPPGALQVSMLKFLGPAALVAAVLATTAWARPQATPSGESTMNLLQRSWRQSLAGAVVLAAFGPGTSAVLADDDQADRPDRPAAERREGDRRDNDRPETRREAERGGDRPDARPEPRREEARRDGERPQPPRPEQPRPEARRDGERPQPPRGEGERPEARRDGDRPQPPRGEGERRPEMRREGAGPMPPRREGDRPEPGRPESRREGNRPAARGEGDRPQPPRAEGNRPQPPRAEGNRPQPPRGEGDRPQPPRGEGDRPNADRRPEGPRPEGGPDRNGPRPPQRREGDGPPFERGAGGPPFQRGEGPELANVVRQLHEEIARLRAELNELRNQVNHPERRPEGR